jgi:hypothetical protein
MTSRVFIISNRDYQKRLISEIQHKLRVLLCCYTIKNFQLLENNHFTFNKSYRLRGVRFDDENMYRGRFDIDEVNNDKVKLRLTVL